MDNRAAMAIHASSWARWAGLTAAASGVFLTALDITVNVALPDIADSFSADAGAVQWMIILYVGASAGMQLGLGGAADAFGLKRMFMLGLVAYTIAVVAIGLSQELGQVLALRVFQAIGNGLLIALGPAIVTRLFPPDFRGRALGTMAALGALGLIAGSLGGGALVDAFGWRAIFLGRLPVCLLAIAFSALYLKAADAPDAKPRLDVLGSLAFFVAVCSFVLALSLGGRNGWTQPYVLTLAILSATAFCAFAIAERRAERPILDLDLLKHRVLAPALVVSLLINISTFVNWFILPFFVVNTLGASASLWGFLLMLMTAANSAFAPVGGWLSDRASPAYAITAALAVSLAGMIWLGRMDANASAAAVGLGLAAVGIGMGLFQSSSSSLIMGSVPPDRLGMGGGILGLARGLGTVSSVAVMGAALAARESAWAANAGLGAEEAFEMAFRDTYLAAAALAAVALVASFALWRRTEKPAPEN